MAANISIMVLPSDPPDAPPQILLDRNGVWLDLMPDDQGANAVSIYKTKEQIDSYFNKIMGEVVIKPDHAADSVALKKPFQGYYQKLVTAKARDVLADAAQRQPGEDIPELRIHIHRLLEWMPWEMFCDKDDFLGLRFRIARLPIGRNIPDVSANTVNVRRVYNLLANNFLEDATLQTVWDNTFNGVLPAGREKKYPPPYPRNDDIFNALDADILHITCHGGLRDQTENGREVYWTLDSEDPLTSKYELRAMMFESDFEVYDTRPLVFGNACASTDAGGNVKNYGPLPGYGASFFAKGALNFVGTFAPITKSLAVEFAQLFYQNLLGAGGAAPLPVAQALWATKNHYRATVKSLDPSYLFYCLYGPPDTIFRI
jgi:hypothetical protein